MYLALCFVKSLPRPIDIQGQKIYCYCNIVWKNTGCDVNEPYDEHWFYFFHSFFQLSFFCQIFFTSNPAFSLDANLILLSSLWPFSEKFLCKLNIPLVHTHTHTHTLSLSLSLSLSHTHTHTHTHIMWKFPRSYKHVYNRSFLLNM